MIAARRPESYASNLSHFKIALRSVIMKEDIQNYIEYSNIVFKEAINLESKSLEALEDINKFKPESIILSIIIKSNPSVFDEFRECKHIEMNSEIAQKLYPMVEEYVEAGI